MMIRFNDSKKLERLCEFPKLDLIPSVGDYVVIPDMISFRTNDRQVINAIVIKKRFDFSIGLLEIFVERL